MQDSRSESAVQAAQPEYRRMSNGRIVLGALGGHLARFLQGLIGFLGYLLFMLLSTDLRGSASLGFGPLVALWMLSGLLGLALHELGHYAAARAMGMRVASLQIWGLECMPRRRGMRIRWHLRSRIPGAGGHVRAFADPARPIRSAHLVMALGGPMTNLALAGLLGVAGMLRVGVVPTLLLMFATTNLIMGLINLVPHRGKVANDGYVIYQLLQGTPDILEQPGARLLRLSFFGCAAERLPEDDLVALEREAFPMPLVALWFRLKGRQNLGDWPAAVAAGEQLDVVLDGRSKAELASVPTLIDCLRAETAFSLAMHTRSSEPLTDDLLPARSAWYAPHLLPRCRALKAAIAGDLPGARQWLERSRLLADNAVDAALPISEGMIRRFLMGAFPETGAQV